MHGWPIKPRGRSTGIGMRGDPADAPCTGHAACFSPLRSYRSTVRSDPPPTPPQKGPGPAPQPPPHSPHPKKGARTPFSRSLPATPHWSPAPHDTHELSAATRTHTITRLTLHATRISVARMTLSDRRWDSNPRQKGTQTHRSRSNSQLATRTLATRKPLGHSRPLRLLR